MATLNIDDLARHENVLFTILLLYAMPVVSAAIVYLIRSLRD